MSGVGEDRDEDYEDDNSNGRLAEHQHSTVGNWIESSAPMGITHPSTPLLPLASPSILSSSDMNSRLDELEESFATVSASPSPMKAVVEAAQHYHGLHQSPNKIRNCTADDLISYRVD